MTASTDPRRGRGTMLGGFVVLMLALTGVFVALGTWQMQRLAEKEALIASVTSRASLAPAEIPHATDWRTISPDYFDYRPLKATGRYALAETVLVFTSIGDARGARSGPGYWVMTPLLSDRGGVVFVNRGFVPQEMGAQFAGGGAGPEGPVSLTGIGRASEAASSFTPGPNRAERIEWVRDTARLLAMTDLEGPVAPFTIDLPAGDPGALPQGGETVMSFPNNHLGYAITWYGFALITPLLLAFWLWRQVRPRHPTTDA